MKIKEQTRKLAAGCSKHCFEVVDKTDAVSSKHGFEVVDRTDEVSNHIYGKATLTWFEFDFRRVLKEKRLDFSSLSFLIRIFYVYELLLIYVYVLQKVFHRIHVCVFLEEYQL